VTAETALDPTSTTHLEIAGQALTVEALDADAAAGVLPALAHLATREPDPTALQLRVWSGEEPVHPLWRADARGALRRAGGGFVVSHASPPVVEVFDPSAGIEIWGTPAAFAAGDTIAHPGSTAIAAWLATCGVHVLHIGAVAFGGVGVLLLGAGGAGKSTTALACGLGGAAILGDDLCAVSMDDTTGSVVVHSLYATLKLNPDSAARLGAHRLPWLGDTPVGKRVVALGTSLSAESSVPIGAAVALRPPNTVPSGLTPLTRAAAVRALVPTGIVAAGGALALEHWFATAMRIARAVDAYELPVSWDVDQMVAAIAAAASRAGAAS
jgi:hypothetical protein